MKKWWSVLIIGIVILNFSFAAVFINEVELNPPGSDSGNEFIELYNDGSQINISGWYLQDIDGNNYTLPPEIVGGDNFFVLDNITGLSDINQKIKLFNQAGILKDDTNFFNDSDDDTNTWQRLPDGSPSFVLKDETKGFPNQLTNITNKSHAPQCLIKDDSLELNVEVDGFCINQVIFSISTNSGWKNFTGTFKGGKYRTLINSSVENIFGNTSWSVYAIDCFNRTVQNGISSFYIANPTTLFVSPTTPDGLNGWYLSQPVFTLDNTDASNIYYKWNGNPVNNYSGSFGLEKTPNNGNVTGGIHKLHYFSNISCKIENERSKLFKFDFTNPLIDDLTPAENALITNERRPLISALLDEIYQSNSGIDKNSVVMALNGNIVPASVNDSGDLDAVVFYIPESDLPDGFYTVEINVSDKAGRFSQKNWNFTINFSNGLNMSVYSMSVYSPSNNSYNSKRVPFNISISKKADLMFINYNDKTPKLKNLCKNCDSYGMEKMKFQTLNDGWNNITIIGTDKFGNFAEERFLIYIDSKPPKYSTIMPRRKSVTNGSDFSIKYSEENPINITMIFNPDINFENCPYGTNVICSKSINLSAFNGQEIEFYFELDDGINKVFTRNTSVFVDVISPTITINSPSNVSYDDLKIPFNISVSEPSRIDYYDANDPNPRWKSLCSRCLSYGFDKKKVKRLKTGSHYMTFRAVDEAGNTDEENINFNIS
ncbi:MAG: lamin tail domain-containing protein [Thermoplasmata archaeon]